MVRRIGCHENITVAQQGAGPRPKNTHFRAFWALIAVVELYRTYHSDSHRGVTDIPPRQLASVAS